jgi:hypothetical protein
MLPIRTQLEVRYTHLIDFRNIYKSIVQPYTKLGKWEINNADTYQEYIVLRFEDEGYFIDFRWDRIVFVAEGKKENLFEINGPLIFFQNMIDQLMKLEDFGKITAAILAEWLVLEIDKTEEEVVKDFRERFFGTKLPLATDYTFVDVGIIEEFKNVDSEIKLQFGPFRPTEDIPRLKIQPLLSKNKNVFNDKRGILIQAVITDKDIIPDYNHFRKADRKLLSLIKQLE